MEAIKEVLEVLCQKEGFSRRALRVNILGALCLGALHQLGKVLGDGKGQGR